MSETSIVVSRTIDAPADAVFDVLSNPERHHEVDGSGMVVSDDRTDRIQATGEVFRMNMHAEAMGGDYQTDNHVVGYDQNKLLAWMTAPAGKEPPGWQWVWELNSTDSATTQVTLTYDWSTMDPELAQKLKMPAVPEPKLEESLKNLAAAVTPA